MQNLEIIKKTIEEFFEKMTFKAVFDFSLAENKTIFVNVKTEEPQILIGEGGQTLSEIQYLLKIILRRKMMIKDFFYLVLDINDYKKKKEKYLRETARLSADEVALSKKEKELSPMTADERRIIHLALSERKDVIAESVGEGAGRRVKIKPTD